MRIRSLCGLSVLALIAAACVSSPPGRLRQPPAAAGEVGPTRPEAGGEAMERREGLLTLYLDRQAGKIWLSVPETGASEPADLGTFLYVEGLRSGLGSNPVGLDRGELGSSRVVNLRRMGDRVLMVEPNLRYRAESGSLEEQLAVRESFARSVLWAGAIDRQRRKGEALLDLTSFLVRDAHDIAGRLRERDQGSFSLDPERSLLDVEASLVFPDNLELEAILTFTSSEPGPLVRETTPSPQALTLIQHHSFIRLPDDGYRPRAYHPRGGSFTVEFADYAAPVDQPIQQRWIVRHRLQKRYPDRERSAPLQPIVYYVDRAIPEPLRAAVVEGVGWWERAFEAAGFEQAFRVELLPEGVHPLDVRYHVVQWVHRSTRGWSYGGGVVDPRTGEMLKGHVRLGSWRLRQDRLLFEGLAGTGKTGTGEPDDPIQLALARLRQLAAHEVGHTLGLAHNFAASTYGGRASVMDYPAPLVRISDQGELDFSEAYAVGVGEWDVHAIRYAYLEVRPSAEEAAALEAVVDEGLRRELLFLSDDDARPPGAAHPLANLWDNGGDPVSQLDHELRVRRLGLQRFGTRNLGPGAPLALLQEVLAPLYLHHRYQVAATVKLLGGVGYRHQLRDDPRPGAHPIAAAEQRRALRAVLATLEPAVLDLPERVLALLLPRPPEYRPHREMFQGESEPLFDPLAAAAAAADLTVQGLLQPQRAARMVDQHRRDPQQPDFLEVLDALRTQVFAASQESQRQRAIRERVQWVVVRSLMGLAGDAQASPAVRARAEWALTEIRRQLDAQRPESPGEQAHLAHLARTIARFVERGAMPEPEARAALTAPPGDPIGSILPMAGWSGCSW